MSDGFRKWSEQEPAAESVRRDSSVSSLFWALLIVAGLVVAGDFAYGAWTKRQNQAKAREERELVRVANERARAVEFERDLQARAAKMEAEQAASVRLNAALDKAMIAAELRRANEARIEAQREAEEWKRQAEQTQLMAASANRRALSLADPNATADVVRKEVDKLRAELWQREIMRQGQEFFDSFDK